MESTPLVELNDAVLAAAWAAGDERAFEQIVARHTPLIFNRCRLALGTADADDATQAVFLVLALAGCAMLVPQAADPAACIRVAY